MCFDFLLYYYTITVGTYSLSSDLENLLTRVMNACAQFHSNRSTKYEDIASRRTDGRTDGQPGNMMLSVYYCWRRHKKSQGGTTSCYNLCL